MCSLDLGHVLDARRHHAKLDGHAGGRPVQYVMKSRPVDRDDWRPEGRAQRAHIVLATQGASVLIHDGRALHRLAGCDDRVGEAECAEDCHRIGLQRQSGTNRRQRRGSLDHMNRVPSSREREGQCEPADSSTNDEYAHGDDPRNSIERGAPRGFPVT